MRNLIISTYLGCWWLHICMHLWFSVVTIKLYIYAILIHLGADEGPSLFVKALEIYLMSLLKQILLLLFKPEKEQYRYWNINTSFTTLLIRLFLCYRSPSFLLLQRNPIEKYYGFLAFSKKIVDSWISFLKVIHLAPTSVPYWN